MSDTIVNGDGDVTVQEADQVTVNGAGTTSVETTGPVTVEGDGQVNVTQVENTFSSKLRILEVIDVEDDLANPPGPGEDDNKIPLVRFSDEPAATPVSLASVDLSAEAFVVINTSKAIERNGGLYRDASGGGDDNSYLFANAGLPAMLNEPQIANLSLRSDLVPIVPRFNLSIGIDGWMLVHEVQISTP